MQFQTYATDKGLHLEVIFDNGTSKARSRRTFATRADYNVGRKWLINYCGDGYTRKNFPWVLTDPKTNKERRLFDKIELDEPNNPFHVS